MSNDFQAIADPELRDVLDVHKADIMRSINCVQIGKIDTYTAATRTADVSLVFKRLLPDGTKIDYPQLKDCPVFILSGGASRFSMPIETGDTCLVLFNDRDIDTWHLSGQTQVPNTARTHSVSDGFVLVGVQSLADVVGATAAIVELFTDKPFKATANGVELDATLGKIKLKNAAQSLKTILDALIDAIALITVTTGGVTSTVPNNAAVITALKVQIALLLE